MSLFVLDTDILTLYYHGDSNMVRRVDARPTIELAISVMTVDEQLTGWYTLTRQVRRPEEIAKAYANLSEAVVRLAKWRISVSQLKALRLNVPLMDLRIRAIALEHGAVVVTRNSEDWLV